MTNTETVHLTRDRLLDYFLRAAKPRRAWKVGMEIEKMGRHASSGDPLPYDGANPSVRQVLEHIRSLRGGSPVMEADNLIGLDGDWGTVSLEPGGQVEWSSRPQASLDELRRGLDEHLTALRSCSAELNVRWLAESVDPELPVQRMPWMPKARYNLMRPYLGARGRLAHRMMTQTASIQCSFDYANPRDWRRKFEVAAVMAPLATALFANSARIDGASSGFRSFRQEIWRETDPDRCGLPRSLFDRGFELEAWLDYVLDVPTMFVHRARGLIPAGGVPFRQLMRQTGCIAPKQEDWETHLSTVFTDVRCYTYIEVRSADLPAEGLALAVPAFWTGILYHRPALEAALELGRAGASFSGWNEAMRSASRYGLQGRMGRHAIGELAREALSIVRRGLRDGAACAGDEEVGPRAIERLAEHHRLELAA